MRQIAYFAITIFMLVLAALALQGDDMTVVVFETNKGTIKVQLDRDNAPITTENFLSYVSDAYYDGTIFHRVIDGFMIQGGGFTPDGNQKSTKAPIQLESKNGLSNKRGTIAMARTSNPNSATSQFFINLVDNDMLDYAPNNPGYAVFGEVVEGLEVVDTIAKVNTGRRGPHADWPENDVVIEKAYIE